MQSRFVISVIIAVLVISGLCVVICSGFDNSLDISNKTEVRICVDNPIAIDKFINECENSDYYRNVNGTTLNWLKSLCNNHMVFISGDESYIIPLSDVNKLPPIEYVTDISIYDICNCTIREDRPLGDDLGNIKLISDVEFIYQDVEYYDV